MRLNISLILRDDKFRRIFRTRVCPDHFYVQLVHTGPTVFSVLRKISFENDTFQLDIAIPVQWHISSGISARTSCVITVEEIFKWNRSFNFTLQQIIHKLKPFTNPSLIWSSNKLFIIFRLQQILHYIEAPTNCSLFSGFNKSFINLKLQQIVHYFQASANPSLISSSNKLFIIFRLHQITHLIHLKTVST